MSCARASDSFFLVTAALALLSIGTLMIFSTTSAEVLDHDLAASPYASVIRHLCYAAVGFAIAVVIATVGYHRVVVIAPLLFGLVTFLLLMTLIPGVGREVNGSRRWLALAGLTFQPSEFVKFILPFFLLHRCLKIDLKKLGWRSFLRLALFSATPILLILLEPNNGTAILLLIVVAAFCFLLEVPHRFWAMPLLLFLFFAGLSAWQLPYVAARINVYLHPESDLHGKGHQPYQAKVAAGSGRLWGKGPGNSWQKLSYLPEAQNDYIAAIYAEEYGFAGILLLIFLYMLLCTAGFRIAYSAVDAVGFYVAAITVFVIGIQAFLNLAVVSGLIPSTGLNLPLFSQGGSSLIANMAALGLLSSVKKLGAGA